MNMFLASFSQVSSNSERFTADKNGNLPYIGNVVAGKSTSFIINGSVFEQQELKPRGMYLCQNVPQEYEGETYQTVSIVSEVSAIDIIPMSKQLGKPVIDLTKVEENHAVANEVVETE